MLRATGVTKTYRTGASAVHALRQVDRSMAAGELVAVMGPSGSGKTTLLNCLSGLDDIDAGTVVIDGESIHEMSDAQAGSQAGVVPAYVAARSGRPRWA